jgi:hypothetical protein
VAGLQHLADIALQFGVSVPRRQQVKVARAGLIEEVIVWATQGTLAPVERLGADRADQCREAVAQSWTPTATA